MTEAPMIQPGEVAGWPKLVVTYTTEPANVAPLLPPGLEPLDPTVTIAFYCVPVLGEPEYGVSVKVPAAWQGVEGQYNLGLGIDQEAAVHISAETNGQPKFLCDISLFRVGDAVTARATHQGYTFVEFAGRSIGAVEPRSGGVHRARMVDEVLQGHRWRDRHVRLRPPRGRRRHHLRATAPREGRGRRAPPRQPMGPDRPASARRRVRQRPPGHQPAHGPRHHQRRAARPRGVLALRRRDRRESLARPSRRPARVLSRGEDHGIDPRPHRAGDVRSARRRLRRVALRSVRAPACPREQMQASTCSSARASTRVSARTWPDSRPRRCAARSSTGSSTSSWRASPRSSELGGDERLGCEALADAIDVIGRYAGLADQRAVGLEDVQTVRNRCGERHLDQLTDLAGGAVGDVEADDAVDGDRTVVECVAILGRSTRARAATPNRSRGPRSGPRWRRRQGGRARTAVRAAPTVPEIAANGPTFWAEFTPDTTRSGSMPSSSRATVTASAGVPSTAVPSTPLAVVPGADVTAPSEVVSEEPDWFSAGATMTSSTSSSVDNVVTSESMPGAPMPSSFVTRIVSGSAGASASVELEVSPAADVGVDSSVLAESSESPHAARSSRSAVRAARRRRLKGWTSEEVSGSLDTGDVAGRMRRGSLHI